MQYLLLLAGFVLLIKGADWFVDGAADAAPRLRIPSVIVGLTIVSLGTSLPELSVSLTSALQSGNALALSNVIGGNLFNTLVVVGCGALIAPFAMSRETRYRDTTWNLGITSAAGSAGCGTRDFPCRWMCPAGGSGRVSGDSGPVCHGQPQSRGR